MPVSPHDAIIDLIGSAAEVRSDDNFLQVVHQMAVDAKQAKEDREDKNGHKTEQKS
jgi:hypothetical protein